MLLGRVPERAALSQLLDAARAGRSGVLVVRGEPGVGKTALLEYAIESAAGLRVARVAGVESEMELAFAALQQLAVVEGRYTMESTDGPLESARIRCPHGHWFNGPVEYLTVPRHGHGRHDAGGRPRGGNPDSRGGSWRVPAS